VPKDEKDYYGGHAAGDVAATYADMGTLAATLSNYIERIPNTAPRLVARAAQRAKKECRREGISAHPSLH
jgi:hypothetical protein